MTFEDKLAAVVAKHAITNCEPDVILDSMNVDGAALFKAVYKRLSEKHQEGAQVVYDSSGWLELFWGDRDGDHLTLGTYGSEICQFYGSFVVEDGWRSCISGEVHANSRIPKELVDSLDKIIDGTKS